MTEEREWIQKKKTQNIIKKNIYSSILLLVLSIEQEEEKQKVT